MQQSEIQSVKQRFRIIGTSELVDRAIDIAVQVAPTDLSVLITGESGVGKEIFPQIIHHYSHRKHGPYIAVNCGAIPEGTIDSELFGHEKGSFTGATTDRKGYFEVADGGTIFLDEVGELPLSTQVRLLRVLESSEFIKVGSSKVQKTNVRVVAATNLNMSQAISEGRFREDLFYRLNTVPIAVPSLRERKEDVVLLFRKFAADFAEKYRMPPIKLSDDAKLLLTNYYWNGNVRQLKNITEQISVIEQQREITSQILQNYLPQDEIKRYPALLSSVYNDKKSFSNEREILYQVLFDMKKDVNDLKKLVHDLMNGQPIDIHDSDLNFKSTFHSQNNAYFPSQFGEFDKYSDKQPEMEDIQLTTKIDDMDDIQDADEYHVLESSSKPKTLAEMEKKMIADSLERCKGKRKLAAKELNVSERTLYRKLKEYGLDY